MSVDIGLWRSTLGDTWPHRGADVDFNWVPQSTHVVWEAPALVMCATAGGSATDPMLKSHLDPLLATALDNWMAATLATTAEASLESWFRAVQASFETIDEPLYVLEHGATAVAVLIRDDGAAIGNVGMDRAWRRRGRQLEAITSDVGDPVRDYSGLGPTEIYRRAVLEQGEPIPTRLQPTMLHARPRRDAWEIRPLDVLPGDVIVLASGIHATQLGAPYLAAVIESLFEDKDRLAGAQDLATRLGESAVRDRPVDKHRQAEWNVHSRLAIAVVWLDD